jgi:catechol 2,3-dioxygenase-like lactoylglutathione lyase family enzyme
MAGAEPMIGKLNHVGVATPSIEESLKVYRDLLGATSFSERFALPAQGVWVCFVNLPNSQIELIEPYGEDSPIHGFLAKNPKGTTSASRSPTSSPPATRCGPRAPRCWGPASRASAPTACR